MGPRADTNQPTVALQEDGLTNGGFGELQAFGENFFVDLRSAFFVVRPRLLGPPASTIMMAMSVSSVSVSARPATTSSKVAASPSSKVGWGSRYRRLCRPPGRPRWDRRRDARDHQRGGSALMAKTSCGLIWSARRWCRLHGPRCGSLSGRTGGGAVDETAGQNGWSSSALSAEERARDFPAA